MHFTYRGFTLIELVIVIAVLGILLVVSTVGMGGYINTSNDRARESDTRQWASTFDLYKNRYAVYPVMSTSVVSAGRACLGKFPSTLNRCGEYNRAGSYYSDTTADAMITRVQKIGKVPTNSGIPVKDMFSGPIVYVTQSSDTPPYTVTANFLNYFLGNCPSGFSSVAPSAPYSNLLRTSNGTRLCNLQKSFTFNPN